MPDPVEPAPEPPTPSPGTSRLDRAPGERYRAPARETVTMPSRDAREPSATVALATAAAVALMGALLYALLGQVDLGFGLVAVAMFIGWAVALALVWNGATVRRRPVVAAALGGGAIVLGLLLAWAWAGVEGGVLGPLDYVNERYGVLGYLEIAAAAAVAWYRAR